MSDQIDRLRDAMDEPYQLSDVDRARALTLARALSYLGTTEAPITSVHLPTDFAGVMSIIISAGVIKLDELS